MTDLINLPTNHLPAGKTAASIIILIVEDDSNDREIMLEAVRNVSLTYNLVCLDRADKAKTYVELLQIEELPKVIILDLNLPFTSGMELLETIKKDEGHNEIPVAIYTTSDYNKRKEEALALGACAYFVKKGSLAEVEADLKEMITYCNTL